MQNAKLRTPLEPWTVAPAKGREHSRGVKCRYGKRCQRPNCIYGHPQEDEADSGHACLGYIARRGSCKWGDQCWYRHPAQSDLAWYALCYKRKPCYRGDACTIPDCCFHHPREEDTQPQSTTPPSSPAADPLDHVRW